MSLRARVVRSMLRVFVKPKFERAGRSVTDLRRLADGMIKSQKLPAGTETEAVTVGGLNAEWVAGPGARSDHALLYLHGGAFVSGSPATHRELVALVSAASRARALVPAYRLAPEHPFPAAMQDVIAAYHGLLESGFDSRRLAIGGDSSGGGLALQTLLALRDDGTVLPASAFFLSPAVDWVGFDGESYTARAALDPMLVEETCRYTASLYVGDNDPKTPLLQPTSLDLSGLPPLCIHAGDHELPLGDSQRLAARARACGVEVELKIWPGMWHVFQMAARFVPESRRSIDEVGRFVTSRFG